MEVKSRHHLREDEAEQVRSEIQSGFKVSLDGNGLELIETDEHDFILVEGEPLVLVGEEGYILTVKGALETNPTENIVVVDEGAVEFVTNGADVMRPGIVEADKGIQKGDYVVVVEENHRKPLAVGRALVDSEEMTGDSGRVIESLHYVGDDIWGFEP